MYALIRNLGTLILLLLCLPFASWTQQVTDGWTALAKDDAELRGEIIETEMVLDLVQPRVADSVAHKRRQRHIGFGGWFIRTTWARYWEYYDSTKQKLVGTQSRPYKVFDGVAYEKDINIFVMPHLPAYVDMAKKGFDRALDRHRDVDGFRFDQPANFPLPEALKYEDRGYLTIECEITPPQAFVEDLHHRFMPSKSGTYGIDSLPFNGVPYPSIGMSGVWCMDCNHNCRPEIHPMEWMWWLDLSKDRPGGAHAKSWMVALLTDDSKRFPDWNGSPMVGDIAIPVFLPAGKQELRISLEFLGGDPVGGIAGKWPGSDAGAWLAAGDVVLPLPGKQGGASVSLKGEGNWPASTTRVWLSEAGPALVGGTAMYLHIATQVTSLVAMRATVDY